MFVCFCFCLRCFLFATIPGIILTWWTRDCKYFPLSLRRPSVSIKSFMAREEKNNTLLDDLNMESIQRVLPVRRNCWETSSHVKHIINSGDRTNFPPMRRWGSLSVSFSNLLPQHLRTHALKPWAKKGLYGFSNLPKKTWEVKRDETCEECFTWRTSLPT